MQNEKVQNYLVDKGTQYLSRSLDATVEIDNINIIFFDKIAVDDISIKDKAGEPIAFITKAKVNISLFSLANKKIHIDKIEAEGVDFKLTKAIGADDFNIDYIIDQLINDADEELNSEPKESNEQSWEISFGALQLKNTAFKLDDKNGGLLLTVDAPELNTTIKSLGEVLEFGHLYAKEPLIYIEQNVSYNQSDDDEPSTALIDLDVLLKFDGLDLEAGRVEYLNAKSNSKSAKGLFNSNNFIFNNLNAKMSKVEILDDTLLLGIKNLSFKERSGLQIKKAKADVVFQPKKIDLKNLLIQTPKSKLKNSLQFTFKVVDDFDDFINKVKLKSSLVESELALSDINYFVPLDTISQIADSQINEVIKINGDFRGAVNALRGKNIKMQLADHTFIDGKFSLRDIANPENTFLDVQLTNLETDIDEVTRLMPQLKIPDEIKKIGAFQFKGNFTGFYNDFVAYGDLQSAYGNVSSDINVKLFDIPFYKGTIKVKDFDLNKWLDGQSSQFGKTSFNVSVNGSGFTLDELNADVDGTVAYFDFDGHTYKDIKLDGIFDKKQFKGKFNIDDPVLDLNFDGAVDLNGDKPQFAINSNIENLSFQELHLTKQDIRIKAKTKLNMQGDDIDNFTGNINLIDVVMVKDSVEYGFGNIDLSAEEEKEARTVTINSEILEGSFEGKFSFRDIHYALQNITTKYISYNFLSDTKPTTNTFGEFEIKLKDTELIQPFLPIQLDSLYGTTINGKFNTVNNSIDLTVNTPKLVFAENSADSILIKTYTENGLLKVEGTINELYTLDSIKIESTRLEGTVKNDTLQFVLNTAQANAKNRVLIDGKLSVLKDTLSLALDATEIYINDKLWAANSGTIKYLNTDYFLVEDFELISEGQSVYINNQPLEDGSSITTINGESLNLEDLASIAGPGRYKIKGQLNGNLFIEDLLKIPAIEGDFNIENFYYNQTFLGDFEFEAKKFPGTKKLETTINLIDTTNLVQATGFIDYGKTDPQIDFDIGITSFSLEILQDIIGDHIYNTRGIVSGQASISGNLMDPDIEADLEVLEAGTTLRYLQCDYAATGQMIKIYGRKLFFNDFWLSDKNDNMAIVNGLLDLSDFNKIFADINIFTPNFQFLNTQRADNDYFFGQAFAEGVVFIEGFFDDISINADVTSSEGTSIKLPLDSDYEASEETFYTFINTGVNEDSLSRVNKKYDLDLSRFNFYALMNVTDNAEIQIIFDQQAGDIIKSKGEGNIKMEVNTLGDFAMFGNYEIKEGDYLFTLQNIINKKFKIKPGGDITWSGDPLEAQIDLDAQYERKAIPADLMNEDDPDKEQYSKPFETVVNLNMAGLLSKPEIKLSIDVENTGTGAFELNNRIAEINSNEAELNKQVVGLLLLNRFLPNNEDITAITSDALQTGVNSLSEYFSNQVSIYLSDALSNVFDNVDVSYQNYDASGNAQDFSNEFQLALGKKFFNNRLYINVGGNLQVGDSNDSKINDVLGGDFLIEYSLSDDGQIKIKAYSKSDYDIAKYNKTGIGLSYQKSFSDYKNIIKKRKNKAE